MTIQPTESVGGLLGNTPSATTTAPSGASADKDMFLQLLVAQMKYQDPMNPTDSGQFLAQSAQFTALEKMQNVADQTAALFSVSTAFGASSLIGREVSWEIDGKPGHGTVSGVSFGATGPVLEVGGTEVPLASVLSVQSTSAPSGQESGTPQAPSAD